MSSSFLPYVEFLLRLGDDALVLGHRLSEWCGHAPLLEEDLALANIALDCLGQANAFLSLAAEIVGDGKTVDDFVFLRDAREFRNVILTELPTRSDFGILMAKHFLLDAFRFVHFEELSKSTDPEISGRSAKCLKEVTYHLRHSSSWIIRLGDGTPESHERIKRALEEMAPYTDELFQIEALESSLAEQGICCLRSSLYPKWKNIVDKILADATLPPLPSAPLYKKINGWLGNHSEHLGHMLAEMQCVYREHPGAKW